MRVGVYVDGFNLYYGGRAVVAEGRRNQPGWRWLDLRKLSQRLIDRRREWHANGAVLDRVIYCTAFIDGRTNPEADGIKTGTLPHFARMDPSMPSSRADS